MVLANEVNPVNELYRDLSGRYKAGWTFHRFIQGLRKFFGSRDLDDRTPEFQSLYQSLREVSLRLNDMDIPPVVGLLEEVRHRLDSLIEALDQQDRKISPSLVRLFFQRVKSQDERILIELIRFYLEAQRGRDWSPERLDKVDYLLSRLGQAITDPENGADTDRLKRVLGGIADYQQSPKGGDPQKTANRMKLIQAVRDEIEEVDSFETLTERDLVSHYRSLKHGLGALLFDKSLLPMVVSTNLALSARVDQVTEAAQERIFEDYGRVSELEERGLLGHGLAKTVSKLHSQVVNFREQVDEGTIRIEAIAGIQESVQDIFGSVGAEELTSTAGLAAEPATVDIELSEDRFLVTTRERTVLGSLLEELLDALRQSGAGRVEVRGLDPLLVDYRLGPREIEAFARLSGEAECDRELERLLLVAVCLRRKIKLLIEELHQVGAESKATVRKKALEEAEACLRMGDLYARKFDHFLEQGTYTLDGLGLRQLKAAKMQLVREHSGMWLLLNDLRR